MSDQTGAHVDIQNISLRYPQAESAALQDVSLTIHGGETLVILGPSGCGKSTLLRTINRLIRPDTGTIFIDEADIANADIIALRRSIGYVIQSAGLFPHLRIRENIAFVPSLLGWTQAKIDARVDELLQLVRLDPKLYRDRKPASLSGGEAQRIGVARALAANPRLLLMDEPFGALDPVVRLNLQDEIRNIIRMFGTTTVFVTHDVDEALRLADRIVVMQRGNIRQIATPLEILRTPADAHVAALLGTQSLARRLSLISVREAMVTVIGDASLLPKLDLPGDAMLDRALDKFLGNPTVERFRIDDDHMLQFTDVARAVCAERSKA